jgi:hypothetical protein
MGRPFEGGLKVEGLRFKGEGCGEDIILLRAEISGL